MKLISILMMLCFINVNNEVINVGNCNAELTVEKNRHNRSTDNGTARFRLVLKNTSNSKQTYQLSTMNMDKPGNNKMKKNFKSLPDNVAFKFLHKKSLKNANEVTLNGGEVYKFMVDVTVPDGTQYNTWGCIEVTATTAQCKSTAKTFLNVYVSDPSEE